MVKKRFVIYLIVGIAIGTLSTLLCLSLLKYCENNTRYKACLERDYSFVDFNRADYVLSDNDTGVNFYFGNLKINKNNETTLFFDSWSGQIRQYYKGVLVLVAVGEYEKRGITYKQHQIRTIEECEAILQQVNEVDAQYIQEYKIWEAVSGEVFID